MTFTTASNILSNLSDETIRVNASDWAVNTLRESFDRLALAQLLREESDRCEEHGIAFDGSALAAYCRVRRNGSRYALNRGMRIAVYMQLCCRAAR